MNLDLGSFAYGGIVLTGGNTPSWGTSLGQSQPDYKFTYLGAENILIGMMYCSTSLRYVSLPLGKGGRVSVASDIPECQLASLFKKVYINETKINYPFLMVLIKEESASHYGRRTIKYSDKIVYNDGKSQYNNQYFIKQAKLKLGLADEACWFIYKIEVRNQDELHMYATIVDANNSVDYPDSQTRKKKWLDLLDVESKKQYLSYTQKLCGFSNDKYLQQIFYGAPGTGKSHKIKDNAKVREADEKNLVFRTTFHPDSDYSTFVGAYKPTMRPVPNQYKAVAGKDEEITYSFVPQAFLQAYVAAWNNQGDDVFLIIEEINRGNCAQIFGDLFQLLDRDGNGFSEYSIMADKDLAKYLGGKDEDGQDILTNKEGIKDGKLRLPNNLYIWATMNTSDQSLFPIDSAFKRRWEWKYIKIKEGRDENGNKLDWKVDIKMDKEGTLLPWWNFIKKINEIIASMTSSADKQLGYFFCCAKDGVIDEDTFVSKVIFYLWNDVFKDYGFEDASLFCYTDKEGKEQDLTFPDFYDEDGEKVNTERLTDFVKKVMSWKADSKKDEDK